jgi:DNA-binding beta-propeller fold protein YncE
MGLVAILVFGCDQSGGPGGSGAMPHAPQGQHTQPRTVTHTSTPPTSVPAAIRAHHGFEASPFRNRLPGQPPVQRNNVYAGATSAMLRPTVSHDPAYVYVPDSRGTKTTVIDQRTHRVVRVIRSGELSQHVTPSYDLRTLYVEASAADRLVAINPRTARVVRRIPVARPYNLYFTPDGRQAIVMVEQHDAIRFVDPHTFKGRQRLTSPHCDGPNHADFSANGRFFVVSCEFSGTLLKVSTVTHRLLGRIGLGPGSMPQDVRLSPDGRLFFVAEMGRDEVALINAARFRTVGSIATPSMPHGLIPSRDGRRLYVTDRGAGEVSVVSFASHRILDTWVIPGGGSPDMGGVSANGRVLWVSGRYDGLVYAFSTTTGRLVARIPVGGSPHGLLVWPQPGRYSLGHTGNTR